MSYVSKNALIFDASKNTVKKIHKMNEERYTFPTFIKGNYVYVIGGRTYGEDNVAIKKQCERYK